MKYDNNDKLVTIDIMHTDRNPKVAAGKSFKIMCET